MEEEEEDNVADDDVEDDVQEDDVDDDEVDDDDVEKEDPSHTLFGVFCPDIFGGGIVLPTNHHSSEAIQ